MSRRNNPLDRPQRPARRTPSPAKPSRPAYSGVPTDDSRGSNVGMPSMHEMYDPPTAPVERPRSARLGNNPTNLRDRVQSMAGRDNVEQFNAPPPVPTSMPPTPMPSRPARGPPGGSNQSHAGGSEADDFTVNRVRSNTSSRRGGGAPPAPPALSTPASASYVPARERSETRTGSRRGAPPPVPTSRPESSGASSSSSASKPKVVDRKDMQELKVEKEKVAQFMGRRTLQFGLWAHRMGYCSAVFCLVFGAFAVAFSGSETYGCKIDDELIDSRFLYNLQGNCPTQYTPAGSTDAIDVCCNTTVETSTLGGLSHVLTRDCGILYIIYSIFIVLIEDVQFGFGYGMYFPSDNWFYDYRVSPLGILHIIIGIVGLTNLGTALAGIALIINGCVYLETTRRQEAGDGGREQNRKATERKKAADLAAALKAGKGSADDDEVDFECSTCPKTFSKSPVFVYISSFADLLCTAASYNPLSFLYRIYQEDKLAAYFWVSAFVGVNVIMFGVTYQKWVDLINGERASMLDGTIDTSCDSDECEVNRIAIKYGPFSLAAPLAKACGGCLNMDCAILLLPVIKLIIRRMTDLASKFQDLQDKTDYFGKLFSYSFSRYVPIQKNIEFHKLVAFMVCFMTCGHVLGHYSNLVYSYDVTLAYFSRWGWNGTAFFTGSVILIAMFVIFSAAADIIRHTKFEIFFNAHHCFIVFYVIMFMHGPRFWAWGAVPVALYLYDRYRQVTKGRDPFMITKVEFINPVMAIYFKPVFSKDFKFKEGQYLYLSCPYISKSEWHPFTISSAQDDLTNGPRIYLETGEEVLDVPRPSNLHPNAKWNKYYLISQNWKDMNPSDYIDKSETGYNDYLSCHIKIHGLDDPVAKSWTRKFKEYLEVCSGNVPGANNFPLFFKGIDHRGDIQIGQLKDVDDQQIVCVDGPHSAPSEHFCNYGTAMMVGGGIGLTPCASVISALIKHRWKKGLNPEILHLYWVVRQGDVDSFQWLVHLLTELSYEYKKSREHDTIASSNYCEFNIFVTAVDKDTTKTPQPFQKPKRKYNSGGVQPLFNADKLYDMMLNPTVPSKNMVDTMKRGGNAANRLQDVWVWNGRPDWNQIFADVADQRQHSEIGVCFCGAPVIGNDLKKMCERYSSSKDDCFFSLHKENF